MNSWSTALMCAYCEESFAKVWEAIKAREDAPLRAHSPEIGVDIAAIRRTCLNARRRAVLRDSGLAILYVIAAGAFSKLPDLAETMEYEPGLLAASFPSGLVAIVYTLMAAACLVSAVVNRRRVRQVLREKGAASEYAGETTVRDQSEVVVSGGYSPFVGAGGEAVSWSFTVDLGEAADAGKPIKPLDVDELYAEAESRFARLASSPATVSDMVFVDGRDVRDIAALMPNGEFDRPAQSLPSADVGAIMRGRERVVRRYKCLRACLWGGQLAISTFYRFARQGEVLFCEARIFSLGPLREEFRKTEALPARMTVPEGARLVTAALFEPLWRWLPIAYHAYEWILGGGLLETFGGQSRARKRNRKEAEADRRYNYAWPTSLREQWSSGGTYERYFQQVDQDFQVKLVNEMLLSAVLSSLESRNVNTEAFKGASHRIVNEGIIISGGTVHADSMTAGRQARSKVSKTARRAPAAAEA
jgi:hypothetical protein